LHVTSDIVLSGHEAETVKHLASKNSLSSAHSIFNPSEPLQRATFRHKNAFTPTLPVRCVRDVSNPAKQAKKTLLKYRVTSSVLQE